MLTGCGFRLPPWRPSSLHPPVHCAVWIGRGNGHVRHYVTDDMLLLLLLLPTERVTDGCQGLSNVNKCNDKRPSLDYCAFGTMEWDLILRCAHTHTHAHTHIHTLLEKEGSLQLQLFSISERSQCGLVSEQNLLPIPQYRSWRINNGGSGAVPATADRGKGRAHRWCWDGPARH